MADNLTQVPLKHLAVNITFKIIGFSVGVLAGIAAGMFGGAMPLITLAIPAVGTAIIPGIGIPVAALIYAAGAVAGVGIALYAGYNALKSTMKFFGSMSQRVCDWLDKTPEHPDSGIVYAEKKHAKQNELFEYYNKDVKNTKTLIERTGSSKQLKKYSKIIGGVNIFRSPTNSTYANIQILTTRLKSTYSSLLSLRRLQKVPGDNSYLYYGVMYKNDQRYKYILWTKPKYKYALKKDIPQILKDLDDGLRELKSENMDANSASLDLMQREILNSALHRIQNIIKKTLPPHAILLEDGTKIGFRFNDGVQGNIDKEKFRKQLISYRRLISKLIEKNYYYSPNKKNIYNKLGDIIANADEAEKYYRNHVADYPMLDNVNNHSEFYSTWGDRAAKVRENLSALSNNSLSTRNILNQIQTSIATKLSIRAEALERNVEVNLHKLPVHRVSFLAHKVYPKVHWEIHWSLATKLLHRCQNYFSVFRHTKALVPEVGDSLINEIATSPFPDSGEEIGRGANKNNNNNHPIVTGMPMTSMTMLKK